MNRLHLLNLADETRTAGSVGELYERYRRVMAEYGWICSVVGATRPDHCSSDVLHPPVPAPVIFADYPPDWAQHYLVSDYARIDPILTVSAGAS